MIKNVLIFGAGAIIGSICSIQIVKERLKEDAELEISEMREYYRDKMKECKKEETITKEEEFEPIEEVIEKEEKQMEKIIQDKGYVNQKEEEVSNTYDIPYVINEEDYGSEDDYDTEVLTYFADKVLVDEVDEIIEDMDTVVGLGNLSIFEEFEGAKTIYVRNEIYKTDFMICKDDWNYSDLSDYPKIEKKPHQL